MLLKEADIKKDTTSWVSLKRRIKMRLSGEKLVTTSHLTVKKIYFLAAFLLAFLAGAFLAAAFLGAAFLVAFFAVFFTAFFLVAMSYSSKCSDASPASSHLHFFIETNNTARGLTRFGFNTEIFFCINLL